MVGYPQTSRAQTSTLSYTGRLDRTTCGRSPLSQRKFGKYLLFSAFDRTAVLARQIAVFAVIVDAKDNTAGGFYLRYGFQPLSNQGLRLLPLATYVSKT
jgi:hypothetical protein